MNQIEKMYENAELLYCNKCRHDSELDCIYTCESKYPSFTAEKQIELIKWLGKSKNGFGVFDDDTKSTEGLSCHCDYGFLYINGVKIYLSDIRDIDNLLNHWQNKNLMAKEDNQ